jgi:hypothetical protein
MLKFFYWEISMEGISNFFLMQIGIWEERKVFGSRGQILKEELAGRHLENSNKNGKNSNFKLVIQIF